MKPLMCHVDHMDGEEHPATTFIVDIDNETLLPVCSACAKALVAQGWAEQPKLLEVQ